MLAEQHDEWAEGRRYLGLDILARSRLAKINNDTPESEAMTHRRTHRIECNNGSPGDVFIHHHPWARPR